MSLLKSYMRAWSKAKYSFQEDHIVIRASKYMSDEDWAEFSLFRYNYRKQVELNQLRAVEDAARRYDLRRFKDSFGNYPDPRVN